MLTYQKAGVSVEQGDKFVQKIKKTVQSTHPKTLRTDFGGFAAISNLPTGFKSPKLVTATDGVGTKLFVAGKCETYHTIGVDLVAMCVNDIVTTGAMPWLFLDYFATSSLDSMQGSKLIQGIARGCREAGCALVGGETAEMPGLYRKGDFDLAGFCVGIVESGEEITGQRVQEGDIVWGLPSSGAHSNGYSLIRAVMKKKRLSFDAPCELDPKKSWGQYWLKPTRIYVQQVLKALKKSQIHAMAHITGGGLVGNVARVIPNGLCARMDRSTWKCPDMFSWLQKEGKVPLSDMEKTFNMGIGYVVIAPQSETLKLKTYFKGMKPIGIIEKGKSKAELC